VKQATTRATRDISAARQFCRFRPSLARPPAQLDRCQRGIGSSGVRYSSL
jgi:hypothetical protein